MCPSSSSQAKTKLLHQLVYFDEEKASFLDHFYPQQGKDRTRTNMLLAQYTGVLEKILANQVDDRIDDVVLIGSQVTIKYIDDVEEDRYTIVFPHQANPDENAISFLSPLGSQLLLSKTGDTRSIVTPSGQFEVQVMNIKYENADELEYVE